MRWLADVRLVVAIGGNALLERGETPDASVQLGHIRSAAAALAPLARDHEMVLCHGNGPQVGLLALESDADETLSHPYPLDVLGAQTQGMIGYWLSQSLHNAGVTKQIANITTQTVVDATDVSFADPSKPIGPIYTEARARALSREHGWTVAADTASWRRVVPSPRPIRLIEQTTIDVLIESGCVVICGGGGGAPVVEEASGRLRGVEAVVDKDRTATVLAEAIRADHLLVLTDVPAVVDRFGTPHSSPLDRVYTD